MGLVSLVGGDDIEVLDAYAPIAAWTGGRAPLGVACCPVVVAAGAPLAVPDAAADVRLRDLPVVATLGLRAYLGAPVRDPGGAPVGAVGVYAPAAREWTLAQRAAVTETAALLSGLLAERAAAAGALAREHAFLRAVVDGLDTGVAAYDDTGRLVLLNQSLREAHGLTGSGVGHLDPRRVRSMLFHPDGRPMDPAQTPLARALRGESVRDAELIIRPPGTRGRVFALSGRAIVDPHGVRIGAVVTSVDITARRQAERLGAAEVAVAEALARAPQPAELPDRVLRPTVEALGWCGAQLWLRDDVSQELRLVARWSAAGGEDGPVDAGAAAAALAAGEPVWVTDPPGLAVPLHGGGAAAGALLGYAGRAVDPEPATVHFLAGIAGQLRQFLERRHAEELTAELDRIRDEFIALAGHALRTPLTSIASLSELLLNGGDELAEHRERLLRAIHGNAEVLRSIIADLLDLAGLESGHSTLCLASCDLARVVAEAVAAAGTTARAAGVAMVVDAPDRLPAVADPARLRQALDNLLSNAVKYSPDGGRVRVAVRSDGPVAELIVADTGLGIPPAERPRLFHRFFRGATAHERGIPGTGLGLALARVIVERHGGSIALRDADGPGATFTVRLPLTGPAEPT